MTTTYHEPLEGFGVIYKAGLKDAGTEDAIAAEARAGQALRRLFLGEISVDFFSRKSADKGDGLAGNNQAEPIISGSDAEI